MTGPLPWRPFVGVLPDSADAYAPPIPDPLTTAWEWKHTHLAENAQALWDGEQPMYVAVRPAEKHPGAEEHPGLCHVLLTYTTEQVYTSRPVRRSALGWFFRYANVDPALGEWVELRPRPAAIASPPATPEPEPEPEAAPAPEPTPEPSTRGLVYFVRAVNGGPIKIGFTSRSAATRLGEIQPAYPYELRALLTIPGTYADECALHRRFARIRLRGEWFEATAELLAFIEAGGQS